MLRSALRRRPLEDDQRDDDNDPLGSLLRRAGRGDQDAFADLYDALAPLLRGIVLKVVRDSAQTEEVTQEAFVELWRLTTHHAGRSGRGPRPSLIDGQSTASARSRQAETEHNGMRRSGSRNRPTSPTK